MYVTARYAGTVLGKVNYLFLLLTEDYIEENRKIAEAVSPLLTKFARDLGDEGALVRPFKGHEATTLGDVVRRPWGNEMIMRMRRDLPALLAIDEDFDHFDPSKHQYIYISLRDSMDQFGNVKVFELQEFLEALTEAVKNGEVFETARKQLREHKQRLAWGALQLKPGIFGFALDLKKGLEFARALCR